MKYRNYFIMFSAGFACAVSLMCEKALAANYLLFAGIMLILTVIYFILILRDTLR